MSGYPPFCACHTLSFFSFLSRSNCYPVLPSGLQFTTTGDVCRDLTAIIPMNVTGSSTVVGVYSNLAVSASASSLFVEQGAYLSVKNTATFSDTA